MKKLVFTVALFVFLLAEANVIYAEYAIISNSDGMILRKKPSTKEAKIGFVPFQSKIRIVDKSGPEETLYGVRAKWYKVEYGGKVGWLFSGFLKLDTNDSPGAAVESSQENSSAARSQTSKKPADKANGARSIPVACISPDGSHCLLFPKVQQADFARRIEYCRMKVNGKLARKCPDGYVNTCYFPDDEGTIFWYILNPYHRLNNHEANDCTRNEGIWR